MASRLIAVPLLAVALGLAGCGGDGDDSAGVSVQQPIGAPDEGPRGPASTGPVPSVVKTATVEMEVPRNELSAAAQAVVDVATSPGVSGFLVSSLVDLEDGYGFGSITVKVPAARFEQTVVELGEIGEVTRQQMAGQDLTADALAARRKVQRATARADELVDRLEAADDEAARAALREQLAAARADLREAAQERAYVRAETAYSPIEVALTGEQPSPPPEKAPLDRALSTAKTISLEIASGAVVAAGIVVPIGGLLLVIYLVTSQVIRRLRVRTDLGR